MAAAMTTSGTVHSSPPIPANLGEMEKEMADLWATLTREAMEGRSLTRACMSNLVIYCDSQSEAETIVEELPKIIETHPARVLLLIGEAEDKDDLTAYISVHYRPVSDGWQLCAEQVTVYCHENAAKRLPSIPRALCIGNLPITLWWVSSKPPPLAGEIFYNLAASVDQVIFDSIGWRNPAKGVQAVAHWIAGNRKQVIYNLAWRRLKAWRKLVSEALAPALVPGALYTVERLEVEHGPHALPVAWLLLGWLATGLNWQPVGGRVISQASVTWRFENAGRRIDVLVKRRSEGNPWIYQLLWHWAGNDTNTVIFSQLSERTLGVKSKTAQVADTVIAMPEIGQAELVAQQLAHRFHDELFEHALELSNQMAGVLLK